MERISEERDLPEDDHTTTIIEEEEVEEVVSDHEYRLEFTGVKIAVDTTELDRNIANKKKAVAQDVFGDKENPKSFQVIIDKEIH